MSQHHNRRILIVDDQASLHEDYRKALGSSAPKAAALDSAKAAFFGAPDPEPSSSAIEFELTSATQGQEAHALVQAACAAGKRFAMAFVDMRMPPGWDGVETIERLWEVDADLEIVICTAFADYSFEDISKRLTRKSQLLILKKPFDIVEVQQLAVSLTAKWDLVQTERAQLAAVQAAEAQSRSYAASLTTINRALEQSKNRAEHQALAKNELLEQLSQGMLSTASALLQASEVAGGAGIREIALRCRELERDLSAWAELSRIGSGQCSAELQEHSVTQLYERAVVRLRGLAEERGCEWSSEIVGPVPERIHTDSGLLLRALECLAEDALAGEHQRKLRMEWEYGSADASLSLRVGCAGSASMQTRSGLVQALARLLGAVSSPSAKGMLELKLDLGRVDETALKLYPESLSARAPLERTQALPLEE